MFSVLMAKVYGAVSIALLCFLAITLIQNAGLRGHIKRLDGELATARTNYARCQANEVTLNTAIEAQNAAVARLKAEGDQRAKEAARAVSEAHRATESLRARERRVAGAVSHEACGDDLILGSVR